MAGSTNHDLRCRRGWLDMMVDLDAIVTDNTIRIEVRDRAARVANHIRQWLQGKLSGVAPAGENDLLTEEDLWGITTQCSSVAGSDPKPCEPHPPRGSR